MTGVPMAIGGQDGRSHSFLPGEIRQNGEIPKIGAKRRVTPFLHVRACAREGTHLHVDDVTRWRVTRATQWYRSRDENLQNEKLLAGSGSGVPLMGPETCLAYY